MMLSSVVIDTDDVAMLSNFYKICLVGRKKVYGPWRRWPLGNFEKQKRKHNKTSVSRVRKLSKASLARRKRHTTANDASRFLCRQFRRKRQTCPRLWSCIAPHQSGDWKVLKDPSGHRFALFQKEKGSLDKNKPYMLK